MNVKFNRAMILLLICGLLAAPALGSNAGPPEENDQGESTVQYGCTCHNMGSASERAVVMITGVPMMYDSDVSYEFTITVADSLTLSGGDGNTKAGFMFSSSSVGEFSWSSEEDIDFTSDDGEDISHSGADADGVWKVTWTAPSEDVGSIHFWLAGNSIDKSGAADEGDYWNILSFSINAPGTINSGEGGDVLSTRTISVGDYETLFVLEETDAEREAARQKALSEEIFQKGNFFYWISLSLIIFGALIQREIIENREGDGPEFLAMELAYPQGAWRAIISILSFYFGATWLAEGSQSDFFIGLSFFVSIIAAYGVYRTVKAAKMTPSVKDLL